MTGELELSNETLLFFYRALQTRSSYSTHLIQKGIIKHSENQGRRAALLDQHGFVPTNVTVAPSFQCNLACAGCYSSSGHSEKGRLNIETIDTIVSEATESLATLFFTLTGGEPLHHAIAVAERHPDKLFQFYTNGTLITEGIAS